MKHHHYMKYLFVLFLFLPTSLMAQNKEEKMPGHITKIQKLEDVNVTGNRPHFIRLKGYYRSYQTNDSVMKYFNDGHHQGRVHHIHTAVHARTVHLEGGEREDGCDEAGLCILSLGIEYEAEIGRASCRERV